ncbi:hypothetical protein DJ94_4821 [Bacillus pseudomycoides]|nr:hypothetical protein DJ94_4821 [Bacillus pseudomycoides]
MGRLQYKGTEHGLQNVMNQLWNDSALLCKRRAFYLYEVITCELKW